MSSAGSPPTLNSCHVSLSCEPLSAGPSLLQLRSPSCVHPTATTNRSDRLFLTTPSIRIGLVFAHIWCQPFHLLGDTSSLNRNHLAEQPLGPLGCPASKVAFTGFGSYQFARARQAETLGSRLMGLQLVFTLFWFPSHFLSPLDVLPMIFGRQFPRTNDLSAGCLSSQFI